MHGVRTGLQSRHAAVLRLPLCWTLERLQICLVQSGPYVHLELLDKTGGYSWPQEHAAVGISGKSQNTCFVS